MFFHNGFKLGENIENILFIFQRVQPNILREMISKNDIIEIAI